MMYEVFISGAISLYIEAANEEEAREKALEQVDTGDMEGIEADVEVDDAEPEPKPDIGDARLAARRKAAEILTTRRTDTGDDEKMKRLFSEFAVLKRAVLIDEFERGWLQQGWSDERMETWKTFTEEERVGIAERLWNGVMP